MVSVPAVPVEPAASAEGEADPAVLAYAQWLADVLALHSQRQDGLSREISALREASMSGAAALVDLQRTVETQLGRLEQELQGTRMALAEVCEGEGELRSDMDAIRSDVEAEVETLKGHFHEVQASLRSVLQQQVSEARQTCLKTMEAAKHECDSVRQAIDKVDKTVHQLEDRDAARDLTAKSLEERLVQGKQETMDYFMKMFKVLHDETNGVVPQLYDLRRARDKMDGQQQEAREKVAELRRDLDESRDCARKYREHHEKLEPRVCHLEELQRMASSEREFLMRRVQELSSGRHASPSTLAGGGGGAPATAAGATPAATDGPSAAAGTGAGTFDGYGYSTRETTKAQQVHVGAPPSQQPQDARRGQQAFRTAAHSPPPVNSRSSRPP